MNPNCPVIKFPKSFHLVEGTYKDKFTIRRVRPQDIDKVVQHLKDHFLRDEPLSKLLGYSEEYVDEFCFAFKHFLPHNMSFWMEDNETGEVAAVRAICIEKEDHNCWDHFPKTTHAFKTFVDVGERVHEVGDIFERYGVHEVADYLVVSCSPKYRNQGLAKELYRRSMLFLAAEGIKLVKSVFTSPFSRAAVNKMGFEEVCRLYYKDIKDNNGNPMFEPSKLNDEHYAALMVKRIH